MMVYGSFFSGKFSTSQGTSSTGKNERRESVNLKEIERKEWADFEQLVCCMFPLSMGLPYVCVCVCVSVCLSLFILILSTRFHQFPAEASVMQTKLPAVQKIHRSSPGRSHSEGWDKKKSSVYVCAWASVCVRIQNALYPVCTCENFYSAKLWKFFAYTGRKIKLQEVS